MYYNNFKDKIKDISNSSSLNTTYYTCAAFVNKAYEESNVCDITFIDQNGERQSLEKIPVILSNSSTIGWFPNDNEYVTIEMKNGSCQIISPHINDYNSSYKHTNDIKTNILTDFFNYTIGGTIF